MMEHRELGFRSLGALAALLVACGCVPTAKPQAATTAADAAGSGASADGTPGGGGAPVETVSRDPLKTPQRVFQLVLYQLAVPQGSISSNADFWKPFDETFLGIWQHDVLFKNGIRVGKAPYGELAALARQLEEAESTQDTLVGAKAQDMEMELRRGVTGQSLFYFDRQGRMEGKDYDKCDNLYAVTFKQTPRRPDAVRLILTPIVRTERERLQMVNNAPKWVQPQSLFELGINLDLGIDECLVIAPSEVAVQNALVVGRAFMMEDRPAQRVEKVLVVLPRLGGTLEEVKPEGQAKR